MLTTGAPWSILNPAASWNRAVVAQLYGYNDMSTGRPRFLAMVGGLLAYPLYVLQVCSIHQAIFCFPCNVSSTTTRSHELPAALSPMFSQHTTIRLPFCQLCQRPPLHFAALILLCLQAQLDSLKIPPSPCPSMLPIMLLYFLQLQTFADVTAVCSSA